MKVGFRKPSIKKSIKARTTGRIKRSVKRTVNPLYGNKGMGWAKDPKKAMYNKIYHKTTFGVSDLASIGKGKRYSKGGASALGCFWYLFLAWWILPIKWVCYSIPKAIIEATRKKGALPTQDAQSDSQETEGRKKLYKVCGVIMKIIAVFMAIFGLAAWSGGMPVFAVIVVLLAIGCWALGAKWAVWGNPPEEEAQDDEVDEASVATQKPEPSKIERHKVAGTSFHLKEIQTLGVENHEYKMTKKQLVDEVRIAQRIYKTDYYATNIELIPEPENPHDPRAIRVVADGVHIGYIKSGSCAHIHKLLDEDKIESIKCEIEGGRYKIVLEDYDEDDKASYRLENDEIPLHADLFITIK